MWAVFVMLKYYVKTRVSQNKTAASWKKLTEPALIIPDMDWAAGAKRH